MNVRITCCHRIPGAVDNPLLAIDHVHWLEDGTEFTGSMSRHDLFNFLRSGGDAYVFDRHWRRLPLATGVTPSGEEYVHTKGCQLPEDPLLNLPDCVP